MRLAKFYISLLVMMLLGAVSTPLMAQKKEQLSAQEKARIEEQRRIIEELEEQVKQDEKRLNEIKKDKSTALRRVNSITNQINSRNTLLNRTEKEINSIEKNIENNNRMISLTSQKLTDEREKYAEMVREAYRNHRQNNYITYILASKSFSDISRRIANIRAVAELRAERMHRIDSLNNSLSEQQLTLSERMQSLDSVQRKAEAQKLKLQSDVKAAKQAMNQLSTKERAALKEKMESEELLDAAINELRKLTKGNTEGASFSRTTSNLNLPVDGGKVRRYKGNMAEIVGAKGASVRTIYDGKVVEVKRNRINGKYDVFVAHGEYITSYANMDEVSVEKGQKVAKNSRIGEVGSSVNVTTMESEYKLVFGIYSPNPKETMRAADCFKKK
ncbi:MAG: peptidoglycan DD-metalloendopeptidase family protein [Alistipes sp.]|jgi:peptidoglycan hydrolase CwlO-like protein|nr:peptidoglycan DD-metalloendopeptidase family protein [Alistipes sp.]